jgi:hypothetical protein
MSEIAELYARDPLELTESDIEALIADLRKRRANFKKGNKTAGKVPKQTKTLIPNMDLGSILKTKK